MPSLLLHAQLLVERSLILVYFQILSVCKKGSSAPMSAPGGVLLILAILLVMLLLLHCFNHEEKLIEWCEHYVTKRLFAKRRLRMQESIRRNTLDKYREEAEPKTQTIAIRFRNLSLSLKKVTAWLCRVTVNLKSQSNGQSHVRIFAKEYISYYRVRRR